ncbi:MAG: Coenzyme F420 hydrogenase/dehydrogenase, beta subunit C-terminal domain [Sphingobium sp.]|uniref:Coenzyme F420 hydrogenase/dehydrogenase, beta subunit C-terminal domain n=1 Tax=Sphingobium sp. TaxID=1912891 RepID=UPI002E232CD5
MSAPSDYRLSPQDMADAGLCIGCGACASLMGRPGVRMDWDAEGQLKPHGPAHWRSARTRGFARLCPFSPAATDEDGIANQRFPDAARKDEAIGRHEAAYVGHVGEDEYRAQGSSGGMATWVASELLRRNRVDGVAHVAPAQDRLFRYRIARDEAALRAGAKSRYYPVDMAGILDEIRATPGRYAVIGIPCFIKAVHLARRADPILHERIGFTLALVCGHMKSRHMVDSFAWQMDLAADAVAAVEYRVKNPDRPANWYTARLATRDGEERMRDWWHLVDGDWGSGFFQNSACDYCDDVVGETADVSFGDAWVEPYSSDGRGTNVVVVRAKALREMIDEARAEGRLALTEVDAAFVKDTQAAGFRQRREGLSYRLTWAKRGVRPVKRVPPRADHIPVRRKLVYRCRHWIARGSARMFRIARALRQPWLFLLWGRAALAVYQGLTYSRGWLGKAFDRIEGWFSKAAA